MLCPDGAELGAPIRVYVDTVGWVCPTRADATGTGWILLGLAVVMVGVVVFALMTPDDR